MDWNNKKIKNHPFFPIEVRKAVNEMKAVDLFMYKIKLCTCSIHFLEGNNLASGYRNWKTSTLVRAQELVRWKFYVFNFVHYLCPRGIPGPPASFEVKDCVPFARWLFHNMDKNVTSLFLWHVATTCMS